MGKALIDFGLQTGQQVIGAGLGMALGKHNDKRQFKQATKLGHLELGLNKLMTDYNFQKQMEMWEATNYSAQMEQLRKAGLNPGLIYGMGGAGGATTDVKTGNISTGSATGHTGEAVQMATTAAQLGLMRAQKENIEADTANKQADTANKPLVGEQIKATTADLVQGIKESKERTQLLEIQQNIQNLELDIKNQTAEDIIDGIYYNTAQGMYILSKLRRDDEIEETTMKERQQAVIDMALSAGLKNKLLQEETKLTTEQIEKVKQEVQQIIKQIWATGRSIEIEQQLANFETSFGKQVGGIVGGLLNLIPAMRNEKTPRGTKPPSVEGFSPKRRY